MMLMMRCWGAFGCTVGEPKLCLSYHASLQATMICAVAIIL